jgi:methionine-rich copper-binding protein CopC
VPSHLPKKHLLLALALTLLLPLKAHAHALLVRSTPLPSATVDGKEVTFDLHFNSRIDAPRSLLILVLPDGKTTQSLTVLKTESLETLDAKAPHLADGNYTLRWQVLANDGHISRGEIPFTVKNNH